MWVLVPLAVDAYFSQNSFGLKIKHHSLQQLVRITVPSETLFSVCQCEELFRKVMCCGCNAPCCERSLEVLQDRQGGWGGGDTHRDFIGLREYFVVSTRHRPRGIKALIQILKQNLLVFQESPPVHVVWKLLQFKYSSFCIQAPHLLCLRTICS